MTAAWLSSTPVAATIKADDAASAAMMNEKRDAAQNANGSGNEAASELTAKSTKSGPGAKPLGGASVVGGPRPLVTTNEAPKSGGSSLWRTAGSLVLVLALIAGIAKIAQRLSRRTLMSATLGASRAPAGILEIIGRYPIGAGTTLMLLKVDRRILLLSQSGGAALSLRRSAGASMTVLCEITGAEDVASILAKARDAEGESIAAKFRELMSVHANSADENDGITSSVNGKGDHGVAMAEKMPHGSLSRGLAALRSTAGTQAKDNRRATVEVRA